MNNKTKAALIGGVVVGLLSAIPFVNTCCCLWAIVGGALAVYMYVQSSQTPVQTGEGAMLGALAGVIGTVIYLVVGVPLAFMFRSSAMGMLSGMMGSVPPEQQEMMRQAMEQSGSIASILLNALIIGILLIVFSTVGGLIGVPLFEKRKDGGLIGVPLFEKRKDGAGSPPPPPPPTFGGPAGGAYGGGS